MLPSSGPLTPEGKNRIERRLHPIFQAEARAEELAALVPMVNLYFGLCGVELESDSTEILPGLVTIRRVTNAPGIIHVCRSAHLQHADYLTVGRYSHQVAAEICVGDGSQQDQAFLLDLAWHTSALIKLRAHQLLACPAAASRSWDTLAAISDNSVLFHALDDSPRRIGFAAEKKPVTREDLDWVKNRWESALALRDAATSRRFSLAFNTAYTWNHTADFRAALASLWSGLEALFGDRRDRKVSQALAKRISVWVPTRSEEQVLQLYNRRCDAVHGRLLSDHQLALALRDSCGLLRDALVRCIDTDSKPLPDWE